MTLRRDLTIAILTFCLTATLLMIFPTRSQYSTTEIGVYDPWRDLNDDGSINIFDCVMMAEVAGTTGTPIDKTALLLELLARIDQLNATVVEQQNTINNMNSTINDLNETVIELNGTMGLGPPDYDSGWATLNQGSNLFYHNLNTTKLFVYLIGKDPEGIHQINIGADDNIRGAYWFHLDDTRIAVYRVNAAYWQWEQARVMIWKIP